MKDTASEYEQWAGRINELITKRLPRPDLSPTFEENPLKRLLADFALEAGAVAAAISRNIEPVKIEDRNRYERIEQMLDMMLRFDDFSLAEYRYVIPGKRRPGIRFKVSTRDGERLITAVYFHDLVFWQVDQAGNREFMEVSEFIPNGGAVRAVPHPSLAYAYAGCTTWQTVLRETMALPFRHLYDPKWKGVKPGVFSYDKDFEETEDVPAAEHRH